MISHFCDFHLRSLIKNIPSYVKDTTDFINKISYLPYLPNNTTMVVKDVESLYTNIDHEEGIDAVKYLMEKCHENQSKI